MNAARLASMREPHPILEPLPSGVQTSLTQGTRPFKRMKDLPPKGSFPDHKDSLTHRVGYFKLLICGSAGYLQANPNRSGSRTAALPDRRSSDDRFGSPNRCSFVRRDL